MRPQNGLFWKNRRDWRHGQRKKVSGTRAHIDSHSHRHEASETERERERERTREREREWERVRARARTRERYIYIYIYRERETDANPPQRRIPKYETNLTQKYFQGVILQSYENKFYKIKFRRIINGKLHIRHVIPEKNYAKQFPGTYSRNNLVLECICFRGPQ